LCIVCRPLSVVKDKMATSNNLRINVQWTMDNKHKAKSLTLGARLSSVIVMLMRYNSSQESEYSVRPRITSTVLA
jgi:hypothetical protein